MRRYERVKLGNYSGLTQTWGLGQEEQQAQPLPAAPAKIVVTKQQARLGMLAAIAAAVLLAF